MDFDRRNIFRKQYFARIDAMRQRRQDGHWFVDYVKKNPLKVGSSFITTYGLIVIFSYFVSIDYFPVFDLRAFASIILASAFTGFLTLSALSIGLFGPAYFVGAQCLDEQSKRTPQKLLSRIGKCFAVAFLAFEMFCFVVLAQSLSQESSPSVLLWLIGLIVAEVLASAIRWKRIREIWLTSQLAEAEAERFRSRIKLRMKAFFREIGLAYGDRFTLAFGILIVCGMELLAAVPFFMMLRDSPLVSDDNPDFVGLFFAVTIGGLVIHAIGVYLVNAWSNPSVAKKHRLFSLMAALATPIVITLFAQNMSLLFALPASLTKIGNFRAEEMTLSDAGCRAVEDQGGGTCMKLADGANKLCNVHVMSRIGSETYLLLSRPRSSPSSEDERLRKEAQKHEDKSRVLRDIYIPTKEILGVKLDASVKNFTATRIRTRMMDEVSQCVASAVPEVKEDVVLSEFDLFEFDRYTLTAEGRSTLTRFAQRLRNEKAARTTLEVVGHADQIGSPYHNLPLSQLRALTVENYLRGELKGKVNGFRIGSSGEGSSRTIKSDIDCPSSVPHGQRVACLAQNRRVEIKVTRTF